MVEARWTQIKNSPSVDKWHRAWTTSTRRISFTKTSPRGTAWLEGIYRWRSASWALATIYTTPSTTALTTCTYRYDGCLQRPSSMTNFPKRVTYGRTASLFGRFTRSDRCLTTIVPTKRCWSALKMTFVCPSLITARIPCWRCWTNAGKETHLLDRRSKNSWMMSMALAWTAMYNVPRALGCGFGGACIFEARFAALIWLTDCCYPWNRDRLSRDAFVMAYDLHVILWYERGNQKGYTLIVALCVLCNAWITHYLQIYS